MKQILLQRGHLVTPTEERLVDLIVCGARLKIVRNKRELSDMDFEIVDLSGCYVTPGLIDLQVNGGDMCNLWGDPNQDQFDRLCMALLKNGVTCFYPTLITGKLEHLKTNLRFLERQGVGKLQPDANGKARIHMPGVHLEGPFISPAKPGVHPQEDIIPISVVALEQLLTPVVKIMTLAPEQQGAHASIDFLRTKNIVVSLGHSNANFAEAQAAFQNGVSMITHAFNALPPIHHRAPGAVAAAFSDKNIWCCLIGDGLHVDPNMLALALRLKGTDRCVLVSDMASVGTANGGLVGSSMFLSEAVRNLVRWKIASFREAISMATLNPAMALGIADDYGLIADGHLADLVVWDKTSLKIKKVFLQGEMIFED